MSEFLRREMRKRHAAECRRGWCPCMAPVVVVYSNTTAPPRPGGDS